MIAAQRDWFIKCYCDSNHNHNLSPSSSSSSTPNKSMMITLKCTHRVERADVIAGGGGHDHEVANPNANANAVVDFEYLGELVPENAVSDGAEQCSDVYMQPDSQERTEKNMIVLSHSTSDLHCHSPSPSQSHLIPLPVSQDNCIRNLLHSSADGDQIDVICDASVMEMLCGTLNPRKQWRCQSFLIPFTIWNDTGKRKLFVDNPCLQRRWTRRYTNERAFQSAFHNHSADNQSMLLLSLLLLPCL